MRSLALVGLGLLTGCGERTDSPLFTGSASLHSAPAPVGASAVAGRPATEAALLVFKEGGVERAALRANTLALTIAPETVVQFDPHYNREKRFKALPLAAVIERGFKGVNDLPQQEFILRSRDGEAVPIRGSKVFEKGAYIAFEDLEVAGWEPIGPRRVIPGPFYLIWANQDQSDLETHPRPYQLSAIELVAQAR